MSQNKNTFNKALIQNLICEADALIIKHEQYTEQYVKQGNEALYAHLAELMQVCVDVDSSPISAEIVDSMKKKLREECGLRLQKQSKVSSVVVRYVVRTSRKTAHVYGRVIDTAIAAGIAPADLPAFIRSKGGIDAVRQAEANAQASAELAKISKERYKLVNAAMKSELSKRSFGTVEFDNKIAQNGPASTDISFTHLLCETDLHTGKMRVVGTLYPSAAIEMEALCLQEKVLQGAALHNPSSIAFNQACEREGLNMDMVLRWLNANGFKDASSAKAFIVKLAKSVKSMQSSAASPVSLATSDN